MHVSQCHTLDDMLCLMCAWNASLLGAQAGQPGKSAEAQQQLSPQQTVGSVTMDLTDGNTREAALAAGAITDFTLGGYTKAIEQGNHPAWGSQRTAQLEDAHAKNASNAIAADLTGTANLTLGGYTKVFEHGTHPAWGTQRTAQLQSSDTHQAAPSGHEQSSQPPTSASKGRLSRFGQSPVAATGRQSLPMQSQSAMKGRMDSAAPSPLPAKGRISLLGQSPSAVKRTQPEGQRSKWGLVPGEDDTLDLNSSLEKAGSCSALTCVQQVGPYDITPTLHRGNIPPCSCHFPITRIIFFRPL